MILLTGEDTLRLGRAIQARRSVKIPGSEEGGGSSTLIGSTVGGPVSTNVFGLLAVAGIVTAAVTLTGALCLRVSGQGNVVAVGGPKGGYFKMPFNGVFTAWDIFSDQIGSIEFDVWKVDRALFPPTAANTIVGANPPKIVGNDDATGTVVGWTDTFTSSDVFAFRVNSIDTIQGVTLEIATERT